MIQVEVLWRTLTPDTEFSILPFKFLTLSMPVWLNNFDSKRQEQLIDDVAQFGAREQAKRWESTWRIWIFRGHGLAQSYYILVLLHLKIKTPYLCSEVLEACSPWGRLYKETIQWCTNIIALTDRNTGQFAGGNKLAVDYTCASHSDASFSNKNWDGSVNLSVISVFCSTEKGTSDRKR